MTLADFSRVCYSNRILGGNCLLLIQAPTALRYLLLRWNSLSWLSDDDVLMDFCVGFAVPTWIVFLGME